MAVFCGVCATQIHSSAENDGAFSVSKDFTNGPVPGRISDTCEGCAKKLRAAVYVEATRIACEHQTRILAHRAQLAACSQAAKAREKERREFEEAWRNRKK